MLGIKRFAYYNGYIIRKIIPPQAYDYEVGAYIIELTTDETTCHQLNLSWGIEAGLMDEKDNTDDLIRHALDVSLKKGWLNKGDLVVVTAGVPLGISGTTNLLKVEKA